MSDAHGDHPTETPTTAAAFWEERYAGAQPIWSGRVNAVLSEVASGLEAGSALDLGCGEGGDAVWLAEHGWTVTAVDISPTAISRGEAAARERGLGPDRIAFVAADLERFETDATFSLVTASFLHSPTMLDRVTVLRHGAALVTPGGHLLITSHAAPPPWASQLHDHAAELVGPEEDLARLDLSVDEWDTVICEVRERDAIPTSTPRGADAPRGASGRVGPAPDGSAATLEDGVVLLHRR